MLIEVSERRLFQEDYYRSAVAVGSGWLRMQDHDLVCLLLVAVQCRYGLVEEWS